MLPGSLASCSVSVLFVLAVVFLVTLSRGLSKLDHGGHVSVPSHH